jgi:hypothetical protein
VPAAVFHARLGQWEQVPGGEALAGTAPWVVGRLFGVAYAEAYKAHSPLLVDDPTVVRPGLHG